MTPTKQINSRTVLGLTIKEFVATLVFVVTLTGFFYNFNIRLLAVESKNLSTEREIEVLKKENADTRLELMQLIEKNRTENREDHKDLEKKLDEILKETKKR